MKKIGFVDYYISEWHANNYPQWILDANKKLGTDYEVAFAWAEKEVSLRDGLTTQEWCDKMGIAMCESIDELCEKSDAIIILAPSDPDTHLRLAKKVLPYSKRTYIDKTFAPDLETAKEIFDIAKKYNTPFFSTSALRCASELEDVKELDNYIITGGGSDFEEYIIHQIEMAVILLNDKVKSVKVETQSENQHFCFLVTESGKKATIVFARGSSYGVLGKSQTGTVNKTVSSDFFGGLISEILRFFETGTLPFDSSETLEVMAIRDALISAVKVPSQTVEVRR